MTELTASQIVHERAQWVFWWCSIIFASLFFLALWLLMEFLPPPSPSLSAEQLRSDYLDNFNNIVPLKTGIVLSIIACSLMIPWSAGIAIQIHRLERGRQFPLLTWTSFGAGVANAVFFIIPFMLWAGTLYRPDRDPELVLMFNDLTWLEFVMIAPPFSIQWLCLAFAGFSAPGQSVFPRWFLYLCAWMAVLGLPGLVAIFFFSGPFAWNGIVAFWVPVGAYVLFLPCCFYAFYHAIKDHKNDIQR